MVAFLCSDGVAGRFWAEEVPFLVGQRKSRRKEEEKESVRNVKRFVGLENEKPRRMRESSDAEGTRETSEKEDKIICVETYIAKHNIMHSTTVS